FRTRLADQPTRAVFRLQVTAGPSLRCPTLRLRQVVGPRQATNATPAGTAPAWVEGFLKELKDQLAAGYLGGLDPRRQAALAKALGRLEAWHGQRPERLARLLVRGYLVLA